MELRAKYTVFGEGARGSLTKQLIDRFGLNKGRDHQKYGIGVKELWQVAPEKHRPGLVQHSMGWPLPNKAGGGSWLYHFDDNLVSVGFVIHLNYENPTLSPFDEFQRFKTHPMIRGVFEGGKRIGYGARAIMEGGWQSVPRLAFPGGCLVGDSAGFVNVPRIKGTHNAILSGMLCAEHLFEALQAGRAHDEVASYEEAWRGTDDRLRPQAGAQRQAALVALRHPCRRGASAALDMWMTELFGCSPFGTLKHGKPDHETPEAHLGGDADRLSEARRRAHLRPALLGVPVEHQPRGGPAEPSQVRDRTCSSVSRARRYGGPPGSIARRGSTNWSMDVEKRTPALS